MLHLFNSNLNPLDQFSILNYISLDAAILAHTNISITNIAISLTISTLIILTVNLLLKNKKKIFSNKGSISLESVYDTVFSIVINQINVNKGQLYFPFIYALFLFLLINNLIGMIPYSFSSTSHFILTFSISFIVVIGATFLGLIIHGLKFFSLFVPLGCPIALLPLLVLIEFISYLARNISLGLRLAANKLSGHMLLNILSGFTYNRIFSGIFLSSPVESNIVYNEIVADLIEFITENLPTIQIEPEYALDSVDIYFPNNIAYATHANPSIPNIAIDTTAQNSDIFVARLNSDAVFNESYQYLHRDLTGYLQNFEYLRLQFRMWESVFHAIPKPAQYSSNIWVLENTLLSQISIHNVWRSNLFNHFDVFQTLFPDYAWLMEQLRPNCKSIRLSRLTLRKLPAKNRRGIKNLIKLGSLDVRPRFPN